MDKLYVIYRNGKKIETISNGYNTERGAKAALTMMVKKEYPNRWKDARKLYTIKEYIPKEYIENMSMFERIFRIDL